MEIHTANSLEKEIQIDPLIAHLKESATLYSQKIVEDRKAQGLPVYNWGLGASPFRTPNPIVHALIRYADRKQYTPTEGLKELRTLIAKRYSHDCYQLDMEDVLVASGLKQLLFDVQRAFGGPILHTCPYWVSYEEQTSLMGKTPFVIYTDSSNDYKLTASQLREACEKLPFHPRLLLFNHPVNPTGASYTDTELEELAAVCQEQELVVFADEVYLGCHHGEEPKSISHWYPEGTIRSSSLSKEYSSGGYRVGWATFPKGLRRLLKAMAIIGSSTYSCAPVPQQYATIAALDNDDEVEREVAGMRQILDFVGKESYKALSDLGIRCTKPEAAWYTLLDFESFGDTLRDRGICDSRSLVEKLTEEIGFVLVAGEAFGFPEHLLYARASFVDFDGDAAMAELKRTGKISDRPEWMSKIYEGIEKLGSWLAD